MANRKPLTNDNGEVRELTEKDFAEFKPFAALPAELQKLLQESKQITPEATSAPNKQSAA
ncbi:hypothetical protein [Terracidiphilus sp.]|jgi:hypothetical protein|uniref:hypothetical protein n=1 Tax=Terracidiphilus sp. TaxID=1964191 RepID=UPI003C209592